MKFLMSFPQMSVQAIMQKLEEAPFLSLKSYTSSHIYILADVLWMLQNLTFT